MGLYIWNLVNIAPKEYIRMDIIKSQLYNIKEPLISIVTPVFNRRRTILRTMKSVAEQSFRDFEFIIVDDGSEETIDDIVLEYMGKVDFPVLFIKKGNGGVHTARNAGVKASRGEYLFFLDSDDEITSNALSEYVEAWSSISDDKRNEYREVLALCVDHNGNKIGVEWPPNINTLPYNEIRKISRNNRAAHVSMMRADIMREHPWPEAEGVKFVAESLIWDILSKQYKTWYLNQRLYVYHLETPVSISKQVRNRSVQYCVNDLFRYLYYVNNYSLFQLSIKERITKCFYYCIYCHVLKKNNSFPQTEWAKTGVTGLMNNCLIFSLWVPSFFASKLFMKKYM